MPTEYYIITGTINLTRFYVYREDKGDYVAQASVVGPRRAVLFDLRRDAERALDQLPHGVAKHMSIVPLVPAESESEPNTFEAHGYTWTRHTPGDPVPCTLDTKVRVLMRCDVNVGYYGVPDEARHFNWSAKLDSARQIIGWARV